MSSISDPLDFSLRQIPELTKGSLGQTCHNVSRAGTLVRGLLAELSGDNIKVRGPEAGGAGETALEKGRPKKNEQQLDLESGSRWTAVGNKRMLVAGKSSTARM